MAEPARADSARFEPVARRRLHQEIAERLRDAILEGEVQPGDRLPPERDLARSFGVNRASVREAIKVLEGLGLVRVRQGDGVLVQPVTEGSLALLGPLVYRRGRVDPAGLRDLLEVTTPLLVELARAAVRRCRADHLERLRELREVMADRALADEVRFAAARETLIVIADATGNRVWQIIARQVRALLESPPFVAARARLRRDPGRLAAALDACLDALGEGDRARAVDAAERIVRWLATSVLEAAERAAEAGRDSQEGDR